MRKTTLRDVAQEAGVSVATVSYVLNNVSNQTIPEETRQRVFEAASKLHYVQNLTAKALSLGKTNVIGVLFANASDTLVPKLVSYGAFLDRLERKCRHNGYHLMVSQIDPLKPSFDIIVERKLDGVFLIDAPEQSFHTVSGNLQYGSPLVVIDGLIDDRLFRKVNPDFPGVLEELKSAFPGEQAYALIHEKTSNLLFQQKIQAYSGLDQDRLLAATNDEDKLRAFIERQGDKPIVVFNEFLAMRVMKYRAPDSLVVVCTSECPELLPEGTRKVVLGRSKADVAYELMVSLLQSPFSPLEDQSIECRFTK
jgi:DNA-binding LacI/PurR family transcriptional regulator